MVPSSQSQQLQNQAPHYALSHAHHHDPQSAAWALEQEEAAQAKRLEMLEARHNDYYFAGRVLLGGVFLTSAAFKLAQFEATREAMLAESMTDPAFPLGLAIALELCGGLMLALGFKTRRVAVALLAYLAVVTLFVYSDTWLELNRAFVLANLGLAASLLLFLGHGAGAVSLDQLTETRSEEPSQAQGESMKN